MFTAIISVLFISDIIAASVLRPSNEDTLAFLGVSMKDEGIAFHGTECRELDSVKCREYNDSMCSTTKNILRTHADYKIETSTCTIESNGGDLKSIRMELRLLPGYPQSIDSQLLERVISSSFAYADDTKATFGKITEIDSGSIFPTGGDIFENPRKEFIIIADVYEGEKTVNYNTICGGKEEFSIRCLGDTKHMCKKIYETMKTIPIYNGLFSACAIKQSESSSHWEVHILAVQKNVYEEIDFKPLSLNLPVDMLSARTNGPKIIMVDEIKTNKLVDAKLDDKERKWISIRGKVKQGQAAVTYSTRCGTEIDFQCGFLRNSLCRTVKDSLKNDIKTQKYFLACDVVPTPGDSMNISVYTAPDAPNILDYKTIEMALVGKEPKVSGWAYFTAVEDITGHNINVQRSGV